jgi:hypothetical protein
MPTATKAGGGVIDELKKLYPQVAALSVAADADKHQQFIQAIQSVFLGYIKQSEQQQQQQVQGLAQGQVGGQSTMGGAPAGGMGGPPGGMGGGQQIAPGGGAGMSGFGGSAQMTASPDELQRVLGQQPVGA